MSDEAGFKPCVLIPVYNHRLVLDKVVGELAGRQLPVILVDDGSEPLCRQTLQGVVEKYRDITLISRAANGGKGAAIKDGLREALRQGFSHAVQIDADGQHNCSDISRFLAEARLHREALVCGYPVYDATVPKHRLYGRYASHIWVWINTLSTEIKDSMCGFRVYPVASSCALLASSGMGDRMDFDGEFIVRWFWRGWPLKQLATQVTYPADGISHFRLWRDNLLISSMHARLFFAMLLRFPRLLTQSRHRRGA